MGGISDLFRLSFLTLSGAHRFWVNVLIIRWPSTSFVVQLFLQLNIFQLKDLATLETGSHNHDVTILKLSELF